MVHDTNVRTRSQSIHGIQYPVLIDGWGVLSVSQQYYSRNRNSLNQPVDANAE